LYRRIVRVNRMMNKKIKKKKEREREEKKKKVKKKKLTFKIIQIIK